MFCPFLGTFEYIVVVTRNEQFPLTWYKQLIPYLLLILEPPLTFRAGVNMGSDSLVNGMDTLPLPHPRHQHDHIHWQYYHQVGYVSRVSYGVSRSKTMSAIGLKRAVTKKVATRVTTGRWQNPVVRGNGEAFDHSLVAHNWHDHHQITSNVSMRVMSGIFFLQTWWLKCWLIILRS